MKDLEVITRAIKPRMIHVLLYHALYVVAPRVPNSTVTFASVKTTKLLEATVGLRT